MVSKCPECILLFHVIIAVQRAAGYLNPMQIACKMQAQWKHSSHLRNKNQALFPTNLAARNEKGELLLFLILIATINC